VGVVIAGRRANAAFVLASIALLSACGATVGSSSGGDGGADGKGNGCPSGQVSLTVKTFEINGGGESSAASVTTCTAPGTIRLAATPKAGFELGPEPWHDINSLNGGVATVILTSGSKCVWVCCPGEGAGGAPCPESDQCF
jgi:hypothetical protein